MLLLPLLQLLLVLSLLTEIAEARKFGVNGPVFTVTLKDPRQETLTATATATRAIQFDADPSTTLNHRFASLPWLDLSSLSPTVTWDTESLQTPLPNWLPSLKSVRASASYQYKDLKRLPSWIQCTAKFATQAAEFLFQPSHEFSSNQTSLLLQATRGPSFLQTRWNSHRRPSLFLESIRASVLFPLSYTTVSSVRVTPQYTLAERDLTCQVEATSGGFGRMRAILNLEYLNPSLSVVHALDERNTIAPTINLYNARIVYQWDSVLRSSTLDGGTCSLLQTKVDPAESISIKWTDQSINGGRWITDIRVPLESIGQQGRHQGELVEIRVRRQFQF